MTTTAVLPSLFLFLLLAATASARPCKTLFYVSATAYYPYDSLTRDSISDSFAGEDQNPGYLTLVLTSASYDNRFPDQFVNFDSNPEESQASSMMASSDLPLKYYTTVSSSIRDRSRDIMSVIGALLFGVGCGALTAAAMYFVWAVFSPRRFDFDEVSSEHDDGEDEDVASIKRKLGYVAIPPNPDAVKKPAPPVEEAVW